MLTEQEYNELLPHRDKLLAFEQTQSYKGDGLLIIDRIRQRMNIAGPVCWDCDGSKVNAINDGISLIKNYEEKHGRK